MMENKEIWKPVIGFEGRYEVSNLGKIKSIKNNIMLKQCKDKKGYLHVNLYKNNKGYLKRVHRLVAEAFIPNPDPI